MQYYKQASALATCGQLDSQMQNHTTHEEKPAYHSVFFTRDTERAERVCVAQTRRAEEGVPELVVPHRLLERLAR